MYLISVILSFILSVRGVVGWGADTHPTIGYIAENYLLKDTVSLVQKVLDSEFHGSLGAAANWADRQGRTPLTKGWHYIDALDNPPQKCGVVFKRDCPAKGGCIISALINQTNILKDCLHQEHLRLGDEEKEEEGRVLGDACATAMKYVIHFFGDITQPLHCSNLSKGGNDIHVIFDHKTKNLHEIWDTEIAEKHVQSLSPPNFKSWTTSITTRISTSPTTFLSPPADWIKCLLKKGSSMEECSMEWASESNKLTCEYVYKQIPASQNVDLGGHYFDGAVPIVETQVAKAGLRLGVFLNILVTGKSGWGDKPKFVVQAD